MQPLSQAGLEKRQATLTMLIDQYQPALRRLVNFYEADAPRREDLFQEILLGLWQAIPQFRGASSERTWLYRIAHNIAASATYTRRRREHSELPLDGVGEYAAHGPDADGALIAREQREALLSAIRTLPAIDRQIVVLHLEGLNHDEIGQVSGLSVNAIATRLSRIRTRLAAAVIRKETHQ